MQSDHTKQETPLPYEVLLAQRDEFYEKYRQLRLQVLFDHLVRGKFLDTESILRDFEELGVSFLKETYMVLSVHVLTAPEEIAAMTAGEDQAYFQHYNARLEQLISRQFSPDYECHVIPCEEGVTCLLGKDPPVVRMPPPTEHSPDDPPPGPNWILQITALALALYDSIKAELGVDVFLSISRPFSGVEGIAQGYSDAKHILACRQLMNLDVPVLCYHDFEIADDPRFVEFSALQLEKDYLQLVEHRDYPAARQAMHALLSSDEQLTLASLHSTAVKTSARLHTLLLTLERFQSSQSIATSPLMDHIRHIEEDALSLPQLHHIVDQVFDFIQQHYMPDGASPPWRQEVTAYVDAHYHNPELNVAFLSDRFQINPSYLSKEVKKETGQALFDYIQRQRLSCAKALLLHGASIMRAAEDSGFSNIRAMRRAFQKYYKTTPSDYLQSGQGET